VFRIVGTRGASFRNANVPAVAFWTTSFQSFLTDLSDGRVRHGRVTGGVMRKLGRVLGRVAGVVPGSVVYGFGGYWSPCAQTLTTTVFIYCCCRGASTERYTEQP
jgi:hypothetical protein